MKALLVLPVLVPAFSANAQPAPRPEPWLDGLAGEYRLAATYRAADSVFHEPGVVSVRRDRGSPWIELRQTAADGASIESLWCIRCRGDRFHLTQVDDRDPQPLVLEGVMAASGDRLVFRGTKRFPWANGPVPIELTIGRLPTGFDLMIRELESRVALLEWRAEREPSSIEDPTARAMMQPDECAKQFDDLFGRVFERYHNVVSPRGYRASPETIAVLRHLRGVGPLTVTEACKHFDRSQSAVSELFTRLETRGFVTRFPDERDRRRTLVWLSDDGLAALAEQTDVLSHERLAAAIACLPEHTRVALITSLQALAAARPSGVPEDGGAK